MTAFRAQRPLAPACQRSTRALSVLAWYDAKCRSRPGIVSGPACTSNTWLCWHLQRHKYCSRRKGTLHLSRCTVSRCFNIWSLLLLPYLQISFRSPNQMRLIFVLVLLACCKNQVALAEGIAGMGLISYLGQKALLHHCNKH